ncbi:MAG: ParB/RepB/Spo0J family partition protein [Bacteriovoracaceae bacterium]
MAKSFTPRVSKRERKTIDLTERLDSSVFQFADDRLLKGARLDEIELKTINVKEQVRTKFNDSSLKELAENIKTNGLIQPLVLHRVGRKYTLICGERRYRAMTLIKMKKCPCFILENKSEEELMAIQFSENTARESLHYIDKADGILSYQKATNASERKIVAALGISKSEVHRSLIIAKLPKKVKEAAKIYDVEKYVLLELFALPTGTLKRKLQAMVCAGGITKRAQFKRLLKDSPALTKGKRATTATKTRKTRTTKRTSVSNLTANALLKAMKEKSKNMDLDKEEKRLLEKFLKESSDILS